VLGREGEGQSEVSRGEGEEQSVGGYSGDTEWEAGQGNSRLDPLWHFTDPYKQYLIYIKGKI
jgi:hypothetical protein